jgi:hypothetical protein
MDNIMNKSITATALLFAAIIASGPTLCGFFIGKSIERFKTTDRSVSVRGLSEREVKADLADLTISFKNPGNDLATIQQKNEQDTKTILTFLKNKGIKEEEMALESIEIFDHFSKEYGDQTKAEFRYIVTGRIKITTSQVKILKEIINQTADLIKQQINVSLNPRFYFTGFSNLRTEMIAEATQSARQAALQFAKDSGSKVGVIRHAVQGAFSIVSPNGEYDEVSSIDKKIRVVTTVTFELEG